MKIFNVKRMSALKNNRIKKYLIYASGEIILVVIGIVIGLQINKLSDKNKKQIKIDNYYSRINEEVIFSLRLVEHNSKFSDSIVNGLKSCLNAMAIKKTDSSFIKNLSLLTNNDQQTFFFPVIDEFLEQGYLTSVKDLGLREKFQTLAYFRKQSDVDDSRLKSFNENILLPKLVGKLNYLDIDYMNFQDDFFEFTKLQYDNDFENNYDELTKDLAIWNLLIYRMDIEKTRLYNNKSLENILRDIKEKTTANN